ncbi:uncharacterized protein [Scyliorhinus torazame]|uniref:uncharacterized protein isoform X1 n=1 Tax=Scyliorhinus torazame TaxID=75743 RepID=UPI003B5CCA9F
MQAVSGEFSLSIVGMWAPQTGPEFIAQRVKHVAVDLKSHVGQASSRDSDQIPEDRRLENATLIFKKVNSRSSRTGENREHKERKRKRTAMRTSFIVIKIFILDIWLRGNTDPITSNPPAVNVSLPRSTVGPVTSHVALSWCAKFITWYSLSYVIEAPLALAILYCAVQTMRLHKWRRAYRARTPVYQIQSPMFGYDQTPDPRDL